MPRFKKLPQKYLLPDTPLYHRDHSKPISRRQLIRQGFAAGGATLLSGGLLNGLISGMARADVSGDLQNLADSIGCTLGSTISNANVPFICFDLAGGANIAGSNVLIGQPGGQMDTLSTAGYGRQGLPGDMVPGLSDAGFTLLNPSNGDFTNSDLNLMFHADSPMLAGILERASLAIGNVDGTVIPARSDNDTANNPHNPLYGIARAGSRGSVVDLIGSRASDSGGNSMAPAGLMDPQYRPTKVDRPEDVLGMVDIGDMTSILNSSEDVSAVMESMARISHKKLQTAGINTGLTNNTDIENLVRCGYIKAADIAEYFTRVFPTGVDPRNDPNVQAIFSAMEMANDREFAKTAAVMFMVMQGFAAGGCITMGGYDYHTGDRFTGENRDLRAGRCIGACLDYARRMNSNLMIYVFSDGSVASNGMPDDSPGGNIQNALGGRGKPQWTGDNSSTAASFILVHNRNGGTSVLAPNKRQIGFMDSNGSVVTGSSPAANNVNQLVDTVLLNYMALNGQVSVGNTAEFVSRFPDNGLGNSTVMDQLIAFNALT